MQRLNSLEERIHQEKYDSNTRITMAKKTTLKPHCSNRYPPGNPTISRQLPSGWEDHPKIYGAITPSFGQWKGTPMKTNTPMAKLLGWPGRCTGNMNVCVQYHDGKTSVPVFNNDGIITHRIIKVKKDDDDPPSISDQCGWVETGYMELAWLDEEGNKRDVSWPERKKFKHSNTDRQVKPISLARKNRSSSCG